MLLPLPLLIAGAPPSPHIVFLLADDLGWANVGPHRAVLAASPAEVRTPSIDALVADGVELSRHYTFKFCSPTRSSLQSGRLPVHVNVLNAAPETFNPNDRVSGYAGIGARSSRVTCLTTRSAAHVSLPLALLSLSSRSLAHFLSSLTLTGRHSLAKHSCKHDVHCAEAKDGTLQDARRRQVGRRHGHAAPHAVR